MLDDVLRATAECRLTTTGRISGEPREIRIWFSAVDDRLFLLAQDGPRAHWVRNLVAAPRVRVRIGARRFEGTGRVVEDTAEELVARESFAAKYGTKYLSRFLREALPVAIDLNRVVE